ncbi:MAG: hypothetical protein ACKVXR_01060 [Planctomycetota bacterium]
MKTTSRREFLSLAGRRAGYAAVGWALAQRIGFAEALCAAKAERLRFGSLDPLVDLMQETPADELLPLVVGRLRSGTSLAEIVGAAALANARAYGGTDYNGYHALMAMMPSYEMAAQMPAPYGPLPVLKVLHRNARFLQESGRAKQDALEPLDDPEGAGGSDDLVESLRGHWMPKAEYRLAALERKSPAIAYEQLQIGVRDDLEVHRVVLSWRAYDLLKLTGDDQSVTMLRQSVRFYMDAEKNRVARGDPVTTFAKVLPKLVEKNGLASRERGTRAADEARIDAWASTIFSGDGATAAGAVAEALAEGFDPEDVGAAMSLAATRLLLNDPGLSREQPGRPAGSVHGASVGVHASDAMNAWRHIARVGGAKHAFKTLIAGAYHTAGQSGRVGAQAFDHDTDPCTKSDPAELLREIDGRIRERDQKGACAAARRYCSLGHEAPELFALLLRHAVSEDGALHAEKYFRTAQDEHSNARPSHRALYLVALTRVMASHHGFPAPGLEEARKLLAG